MKKQAWNQFPILNILNEFLQECVVSTDILTYNKKDLSKILEDFHSHVRMKNGELYKKRFLTEFSLRCMQILENWFKINIISGPHFAKANSCFFFLLRKTWGKGKRTCNCPFSSSSHYFREPVLSGR